MLAVFAEIKVLFKLAFPILIAQLSITSMSFVDTAMAGHYSRNDLAAIAVGGSLWLPVLLFTQAILFSVTPMVSQARGRGDISDAGHTLRQGLWLGLFSGICVSGVLFLMMPLLDVMGVDNNIKSVSKEYLFWLSFGLPVAGVYQAMRSFIEGYGRSKPVMLINIVGLLSNIPLNYIFIYGKLGFPAMGGAGCGIASSLVLLIMALGVVAYISLSDLRDIAFKRQWISPQWLGQIKLIKLGLPIGFSVLVEVSIFAVIALLIAPLGAEIVAGHQVALNLTAQMFMLPLSLSMALTIRIGYFVGQKNHQAIRQSISSGYLLGIFIAILNGSIIYFGSHFIAGIYTGDSEVQLIAVSLLFFAAVYQFPDALQVCSIGILRGFKVTRRPMIITLIAYWLIALPIGCVLGLTDILGQPLGPKGLWMGLVIGLTVAAVLLLSTVVFVLKTKGVMVSAKSNGD